MTTEIRTVTDAELDTPAMWTAAQIEAMFRAEEDLADEGNREATKGPFNPYGDKFDSLIWFGSLGEAWSQETAFASDMVGRINVAREKATVEGGEYDEVSLATDWAEVQAEAEAVAIHAAYTVIGTGRPVLVASYDGDHLVLFCESATRCDVTKGVEGFYED